MSGYPPQQPPPYGMHAPPHPPPTQVIIAPQFGPNSSRAVCPSCHKPVVTRVEHEATAKTHLFALIICLLFCPCACLPYCMDSCQATNHYCSNCGTFLGTYDQ